MTELSLFGFRPKFNEMMRSSYEDVVQYYTPDDFRTKFGDNKLREEILTDTHLCTILHKGLSSLA